MDFVWEHPVLTGIAVLWCAGAAALLGSFVWCALAYRHVTHDLFGDRRDA